LGLYKANKTELLTKCEREREVFAFTMNPQEGLTFKVAGTKKLEDGTETPFEWPNLEEWKTEDFGYIEFRFDKCENHFAKSEYGLFLFYSKNLVDNRKVAVLLQTLLKLAKYYYAKILDNEDVHTYITYFIMTLSHALHIADKRKSDDIINAIFTELVRFCNDAFINWDVRHVSTLNAVIDLTEFAIKYKKEFRSLVDVKPYLDKSYTAALEVSKTYPWGAIYICEAAQELADIIKDYRYDWQSLIAEQFEAMVEPAIASGNLAAVTFVERALSIYKKAGNKPKIDEFSKLYDEVRRRFQLGGIRSELPEEENRRITEAIKTEVSEKDSREILSTICLRPMYASLDKVIEMSDEIASEGAFTNLFSKSIIDKHGNTVEVFETKEEKEEYRFWEAYGYSFQIGTQILTHFFFDAYKAGKINYDSVIDFLAPSWMGTTFPVLYNGYEFELMPLDAIKPGLQLFFDELEKMHLNHQYTSSFICATDSLVVKVEYLLRFFCRLAGIPTFTDKIKNGHKVKNEKNMDEMLEALKDKPDAPTGFSEEHRKLIAFVFTKKMGNNLRHRVAHGLMDAQEYTVTNLILILNIILILSTYEIKNIKYDINTTAFEHTK